MAEITHKSKRKECKCCHRMVWKISQHGLCVNCATEKVKLARLEMKHKEGPTYEKWKQRIMASVIK